MPQKAVVVFSNVPENATGQDVLLSLRQVLNAVESDTSEVIKPTTVFVEGELTKGSVILLEDFRKNQTVLMYGRKDRKTTSAGGALGG